VREPLQTARLVNGFSKTKPRSRELQEAFNKGLHAIKDDGTYGRILQKHGCF